MSLLANIVPYVCSLTTEDQGRIDRMPPGVVGIASGFLGRYREFDNCADLIWVPKGTVKQWCLGVDPCHHFNEMARELLKEPEREWLWILGDDHVFTQDLLLNLYERNVDIVVPLCLRRTDFTPVLNQDGKNGFHSIPDSWGELKGKSGLFEWTGVTGNAGMLIRRNVFEKMEPPWFRAGQLHPEFSSSDLYFCKAAQEAGFKIYIDLDNHIGHINHMAIWPRRDESGDWFVDVRNI